MTSRQFIVKKFGGTSVGSPQNMKCAFHIIKEESAPQIVVLSALAGSTNALLSIIDYVLKKEQKQAKEVLSELKAHYQAFLNTLFKESQVAEIKNVVLQHFSDIDTFIEQLDPENQLAILAKGEMISVAIFSHYLSTENILHKTISALDFMRTDVQNQPDFVFTQKKITQIVKNEETTKCFITQGFICKNHEDKISNLNRGGSDYTASILAAALNAKCCEIWTDIDGIHNSDPRIIHTTNRIQQLNFNEASELAYFGAKVLHPTCIRPAQDYQVPVKILNTMQPEAEGTTVSDKNYHQKGAKAIAAKDGITVIRIKSSRMLMAYGFLCQVVDVFSNHKTPLDMITTSEVAVSLTIDDPTHLNSIVQDLSKMGIVDVEYNQTIVCIVGNLLIESTSLLRKIFDALDGVPVRMISHGGSRNNISLLIATQYKEEVLKKLHNFLFSVK